MNKIRLFTSWMGTKMIDGFFKLYDEDIRSLTREQFNEFRQADMIRMMGKSSSSPPGPTTPIPPCLGIESEPQLLNPKLLSTTSRRYQEICISIPHL